MRQFVLAPATIVALLVALSAAPLAAQEGPIPVHIERAGAGYELLRGGEPYFVKGAVGAAHLERIAAAGGNSVRAHPRKDLLDRAHALGLSVMVNLPVRAERAGMDYGNPAAVRAQFDEVMGQVRLYRDHPAVLFWSLGNELDHIPGGAEPDWSFYDALEELAQAIHETDPLHPVMTVVGTGSREKLEILMDRLPSIDLLGVNTYADIGEVAAWLDAYGWEKPYVFTEWGPTGHWQVQKTAWGRPIEETSSEKAEIRRERYASAIARVDPRCLGEYSFYWRQKQETTHTWYGIFDESGRSSASVDAMQLLWTGEWPGNRAPGISRPEIDGRTAYDDVTLQAGRQYRARVEAQDPDGDPLEYEWEVLPEPQEYGAYAGGGEVRQERVPNTVDAEAVSPEIRFGAPSLPGEYRMHVYVYDGQGHYADANIPFLVE